MKSPKNFLILLLALITVGGSALAWQQYQELIKLRAEAMDQNERADWQKRVWAAEKRRHELEAALAALRAKGADGGEEGSNEGSMVAFDGNPQPGGRRRGPGPNMAANFMAMMDKPEIQKLMAVQQRGSLDARFAALFKSLNLNPDQLEKFKTLLVEKQTAMADVLAAARAQGLDPRNDPQEFRRLVADTQAEVDTNIKATLGDSAYAQYQQYQQTMPQRNVATQLEQSLSYTSTPLTQAQADQLIQVLSSTNPSTSSAATNRAAIATNFGVGFGAAGPSAPITDAAIAQSQGFLSAAQVQALQQLQQAQLAQAQLTQAMRNQFGGQGGRAATPAPTKPKPGGG